MCRLLRERIITISPKMLSGRDASILEGGGQIVRYAFAVAAILKFPLRVHSIRHNRPKPGLSAQHLTSLRLLKEICGISLEGDVMGSTEVTCVPTHSVIETPQFRADAGTAGAITLMIQATLPTLILGNTSPKTVIFNGGTNVSFAPFVDGTKHVLAPLLQHMGAHIHIEVKNRGYFPRGGGTVHLVAEPTSSLRPIVLIEQGSIIAAHAILVTDGPHISSDMIEYIKKELARKWGDVNSTVPLQITANTNSSSNKRSRGDTSCGILIYLHTSTGCILSKDVLLSSRQRDDFTRNAVDIAIRDLFCDVQMLIASGSCCEEHDADQLLIFMALAHGISRIRVAPKTEKSSLHIETAIEVLGNLSGAVFRMTVDNNGCRVIECQGIGHEIEC